MDSLTCGNHPGGDDENPQPECQWREGHAQILRYRLVGTQDLGLIECEVGDKRRGAKNCDGGERFFESPNSAGKAFAEDADRDVFAIVCHHWQSGIHDNCQEERNDLRRARDRLLTAYRPKTSTNVSVIMRNSPKAAHKPAIRANHLDIKIHRQRNLLTAAYASK